jgi:hypothetical protein
MDIIHERLKIYFILQFLILNILQILKLKIKISMYCIISRYFKIQENFFEKILYNIYIIRMQT